MAPDGRHTRGPAHLKRQYPKQIVPAPVAGFRYIDSKAPTKTSICKGLGLDIDAPYTTHRLTAEICEKWVHRFTRGIAAVLPERQDRWEAVRQLCEEFVDDYHWSYLLQPVWAESENHKQWLMASFAKLALSRDQQLAQATTALGEVDRALSADPGQATATSIRETVLLAEVESLKAELRVAAKAAKAINDELEVVSHQYANLQRELMAGGSGSREDLVRMNELLQQGRAEMRKEVDSLREFVDRLQQENEELNRTLQQVSEWEKELAA
ncbi:uncharacterized protein HMPREF1541_04855 [Cyphellophora europaea CBS 101466]|uniref:Uncharacterized protein n=1 Tax=Cyphellophora europaea (strain CBS 101466) TaxID=1220924 RepID=W2RXS8_CYPE1|nr:uncharacterized protein HMPREF1541_04855 [Cyphellophora europaea CBS 101466]ETN40578.1 hypothetical protein HMPREF1541_04855 [Cyphellophora europaea CBS 101466]